ncbi:MAG: hypothetical protein K0S26_850 [Bacteroidota bacterium]|jgi:hypothetical protein|nr:hypothetical protein [Bacteroidota bacterium]
MKLTKLFCAFMFLASISRLSAQEAKTDEKKIQEVVSIMADPISMPPDAEGNVPADTNPPKGMAVSEILKRAVNFVKTESKKYTKGNGVTTGSKAECVISFPYKPKELNPSADVQGSISMHVSIEAKEGKYRYTISKISHNAKIADYSGGDVYSEVPKCGSMKMPPDLWKRIRSEAFKQSSIVVADLKEAMLVSSTTPVNTDEW